MVEGHPFGNSRGARRCRSCQCGSLEARVVLRALELFETLKPDAILLEVDLDREDGFDIVRKVHAMDPGCFIITVSTDHRNQECQRKCYDSGADYHFSKLDPIDGLIAVLNARLGR